MSKKQSTILVTTFILIAAVAVVVWGGERKQPEQPSPAGNGGDVVSQDSNISQNREDIDTNDNDNDPISISDEDPIVITSDIDTSDWKTYRNEELGFEVKYPEGWYVIEGSKIQLSPFPRDPNNDVGVFIYNVTNGNQIYDDIVSYLRSLGTTVDLERGKSTHIARHNFFVNQEGEIIIVSSTLAGEISLDIYHAIILSFRVL